MAVFGSVMQGWRLLREIDLRKIRRDVEAPVYLRVVGEPDAARRVADALGVLPGYDAPHPHVRLDPDGLPEPSSSDGRTVTVLAVPAGPTTPALRRQIERWRTSERPLVTAVLGGTGHDDRDDEDGRVFLPALPGASLAAKRLAPALLDAVDDENMRAALGRTFPQLRSAAADRLIEDASRANAIYSATTGLAEILPPLLLPLTAADLIVLTKNQVIMAYRIALVAGKQGRPMDVIGEMMSVVGGGLFFRQVARELVGLIPVLGWLPKVAIAYAGTRVIGITVRRWAMDGQVVGVSEMTRLREEAIEAGKALAGSIRDRFDGSDDDTDTTRSLASGKPSAGEPIPMPDGDGRDVFPAAGNMPLSDATSDRSDVAESGPI